MVKYRILKEFYDLEKKKIQNFGSEVDFTVKRATVIEKTLREKGYKDAFIERVVDDKEDAGE